VLVEARISDKLLTLSSGSRVGNFDCKRIVGHVPCVLLVASDEVLLAVDHEDVIDDGTLQGLHD
jgi:hypothetical protein